MKTVYVILLGTLIAITLACGYSRPSGMAGGNMPAISQLNPGSVNAGDPAFMLTVNGSNFATKATVNWNGVAQATNFVSAGQLTISVPASDVATATTVQITVTNPATSSGGLYGSGQPAQMSSAVMFKVN